MKCFKLFSFLVEYMCNSEFMSIIMISIPDQGNSFTPTLILIRSQGNCMQFETCDIYLYNVTNLQLACPICTVQGYKLVLVVGLGQPAHTGLIVSLDVHPSHCKINFLAHCIIYTNCAVAILCKLLFFNSQNITFMGLNPISFKGF